MQLGVQIRYGRQNRAAFPPSPQEDDAKEMEGLTLDCTLADPGDDAANVVAAAASNRSFPRSDGSFTDK